jgi:hypothetical protein
VSAAAGVPSQSEGSVPSPAYPLHRCHRFGGGRAPFSSVTVNCSRRWEFAVCGWRISMTWGPPSLGIEKSTPLGSYIERKGKKRTGCTAREIWRHVTQDAHGRRTARPGRCGQRGEQGLQAWANTAAISTPTTVHFASAMARIHNVNSQHCIIRLLITPALHLLPQRAPGPQRMSMAMQQ